MLFPISPISFVGADDHRGPHGWIHLSRREIQAKNFIDLFLAGAPKGISYGHKPPPYDIFFTER